MTPAPVAPSPVASRGDDTLAAMIAKLPVYDPHWPDEMQKQWLQLYGALLADLRAEFEADEICYELTAQGRWYVSGEII